MFKILDKYIGLTVFFSVVRTIFILVSLSGVIKFIEQLKKVGNGNYTILNAGIFTLLTVPRDIEILFPMAVLLGILFALGTLITNSELTVFQVAGFSNLQVVISMIKIIIPLMILIMVFGEWVTPILNQWARNYRTERIVGQLLTATDRGLWAKDGNNFIHIQCVIDKNKIEKVSIYQFDMKKNLQAIIFAASGIYNVNDQKWSLSQIDKLLINDRTKIISSHSLLMDWKTNLTPEKLEIVLLEPNSLAIRSLYKYVKYLEDNGQKVSIYQLNLWKKILLPFSIIVMILIASSFIFSPLRAVSSGSKTLVGILTGFIFYLLNEVLSNLSLIYNISPLIMVILPNVVFSIFSILLLLL